MQLVPPKIGKLKMGVTKKESSWMRVLVLLACVVTVVTALQDALLGIGVRFKENSPSFKVAIFTDLHYGENAWEAWGPEQDANSTIVQSFLLDNHSPGKRSMSLSSI